MYTRVWRLSSHRFLRVVTELLKSIPEDHCGCSELGHGLGESVPVGADESTDDLDGHAVLLNASQRTSEVSAVYILVSTVT